MKPNINVRYLMPQFFKLSKTTVVKGLQCAKYLYLLKNKPKEKSPPDAATLAKFSMGKSFEATFKETFPQGIDVNSVLRKDVWTLGASYTKAVFEQQQQQSLFENEPQVLFEASFLHEQTLVMTDVCVIEPYGTYEIFEVKNGTELKEAFIQDSAIQYFVCKQSQPNLKAFNLVINDGEGGFVIKNITEQLESMLPDIANAIPELLDMLQQGDQPKINMGDQCHRPYDCEYIAFCKKATKI